MRNTFEVPLSFFPEEPDVDVSYWTTTYLDQSETKGPIRPPVDPPKDVNPKHFMGQSKMPLDIIPEVTLAYLALGHAEGMLKYGFVNWRATEVVLSVYLHALRRHMAKFKEGEWADPKTKVPHLANAMACLSIIIDAHHSGTLIDDRPMSNPGAIDFIEGEGQDIWNGLQAMFKDQTPYHYTIEDH